MNLEQIVENIYIGVKILDKDFQNKKNIDNNSIFCLIQENLIAGQIVISENSKFIREQTYQKTYNRITLKQAILSYSDYLYCIKKKQSYFHKTNFQYRILPSEEFLIIRPYGYFSNFLANSSGLKYFEEALNNVFKSEHPNKIELIKKINIPDNLNLVEEIVNDRVRPDKRQVDLSKINIKQGLMTLDKVLKRIHNNDIDIEVEHYFQRKAGLWTDDIKSRFIEALIVSQPVPAFYFDATNKDKWLIVDGLQRLTTIKQFVMDKSIRLSDLCYLPKEYEHKNFDEIPRAAQRSIEEYEIIAYQIEAPTPKEVKFKIYRSINTSSLNLTNQEIRHALNQGNASEWVKELSVVAIFKKVIPINAKQIDRMLDRELCLRYLSFKISPYEDCPNNIQDFLDDSMTKLLFDVSKEDFKKYKVEFEEALFTINKIFETNAFKKIMFGIDNEYFINHIFETLTYVFSTLKDSQREKLINRTAVIRNKTKELKNNIRFVKSIDSDSPYTKEAIKTRFETLINFFNELSK